MLQQIGPETWPLAVNFAEWEVGDWVRAGLGAVAVAVVAALIVVAIRKRWFQKTAAFVGEVQAELKKSTWPTWSQLWDSTMVIIAVTLILSFYIGLADVVLMKIVRLLVAQ
jgi:preprotein translocase subunit SecE